MNDIWERRKDLRGVLLVNSIEEWEPLTYVDINGTDDQEVSGLFPLIVYRLQDRLNFTLRHIWPEDRMWGSGNLIYELGEIQQMGDLMLRQKIIKEFLVNNILV